MSLASRRGSRIDTSSDDAKSSIVGLSGWLFADLLLALAVVFLVASDRPGEIVGGNPSDVYDITVEFALSPNGVAETQIDQIDRSFDIWVRFSEAVNPRSFKTLQLEPNDQWSYSFVSKRDFGSQEMFQIRLIPRRVSSTALSITVERRAASHSDRENSYNSLATLSVSITICKLLAGIAVDPSETASFVLPGGQRKSAPQLEDWLKNSSRKEDSPQKSGYGTASLVYEEIIADVANRRQIGFAIIFGGYNGTTERPADGVKRAINQADNIRTALRSLGLLSKLAPTGANRCPQAVEVPVRSFSDSSVGIDDLGFELYFYNLEN